MAESSASSAAREPIDELVVSGNCMHRHRQRLCLSVLAPVARSWSFSSELMRVTRLPSEVASFDTLRCTSACAAGGDG